MDTFSRPIHTAIRYSARRHDMLLHTGRDSTDWDILDTVPLELSSVYTHQFFAHDRNVWHWSLSPATAAYRAGNISTCNRATRGHLSDSAL